MKKIVLGFVLCAVIAHVSFPLSVAAAEDNTDKVRQLSALVNFLKDLSGVPPDPLSSTDTKAIIEAGTDWIVASQVESGRFEYEYLPFTGTYREDDNTVRQAGTLYILSEVYRQQTDKDPAYQSAIERSIEYFQGLTSYESIDGEDFACIKSSRTSIRCDLGATSLALLGILSYVAADPEKKEQYRDLITNYKDFHLAAKRENAGFSNRYDLEDDFADSESPFFNGEAMLALVRYYQYEAEPEIKSILLQSFDYLAAKEFESPLYLWIMAALKDMHQLWPNENFVAYARTFTNARVDNLRLRHTDSRNNCAIIEGMASAQAILDGKIPPAEQTALESEIDFWLAKNAQLQVTDNPYRVLVTETGSITLANVIDMDQATGGFLTAPEEPTQRIDFTQHCVSAYLQQYVDNDGYEL